MFEAHLNERQVRVDWLLLGALLGLILLCLAFIYSASTVNDPQSRLYLKQGICYLLGLGAAAVLCL